MTEQNIPIESIHNLLMEGLLLIDSCAKKNNFVYYLHAGTVLGSVRHNSFIPWDDDADIIVPVKYYELFIEELERMDLGKFVIIYRDKKTTRMQAKLILKGQDEDLFCIDIFPLIGTSSNQKERIKQCKYYTRVRKLYFWRNANWKTSANIVKKIVRFLVHIALQILPDKWFYRRFDRIMFQYDYDSSAFVTNPCGKYKLKNVIPKDWYGVPVEGAIDGKFFPIPNNTLAYLNHYYKDYTSLPSEEDREKSIHKKRLFLGTKEEFEKLLQL